MPTSTVNPTAPYPTVGEVLSLARVKVNDAFGPNGVAGDLLATNQPATPVIFKSAWRQLQATLADNGFDKLTKEAVVLALPAIYQIDPAARVYLDWNGYFNGQSYTQDGTICLPADLIVPRYVNERQNGSGNEFTEVTPWDGFVPEGYQSERLSWWLWEDDKLYFKGATVVTDLKLRYGSWLLDIDITGQNANDQQVPIMWCDEALACLIAEKYSRPRGSVQADSLLAQADVEIQKMCNRTARRKAPITYRRRAFGYQRARF